MNRETYSTGKSGSARERAAQAAREKIYARLTRAVPPDSAASVLDVGVTADQKQASSNFFEKMYPYPERITALSDQDASWMEEAYRGLKFVRGNGLEMPFDDRSFDLVFSSAVIEHVGSRENQRRFLRECVRVSRRHVYITTPNRRYPIELHTALPLLHWLPPKGYRAILRALGKDFFASEDNLNLLSGRDLRGLAAGIEDVDIQLDHIRFFGFRSNLLLTIRRKI